RIAGQSSACSNGERRGGMPRASHWPPAPRVAFGIGSMFLRVGHELWGMRREFSLCRMPHHSYLLAPNSTSDRLNCTFAVTLSEHGRSGHEDRRTGIDDKRRGARVDAAVDFDLDVESPLANQL